MSNGEFRAALVDLAPEFGLDLGAEAVERLVIHYELLITWNRRINLTRITAPREAARHHVMESIFLDRLVAQTPLRLVDVGSGAGFPGVPLACYWPSVPTVLVEPLVKRAVFLQEVIRATGLDQVTVRNAPFSADDVEADSLLVARALDRFRALLPALLGSNARVVALFSEPDLLATASELVPERRSEIFSLPGTDRRRVGIFSLPFHVEQGE